MEQMPPKTEQKKTPKVLHVVLTMNVGGAEKLVFDMVRHPSFADCRPVICCLDAVGELGAKLRAEGYSVYLKNRRNGVDLSVIPWLREIIVREQANVVHAHQYTPLFYATPAAFLAGRVKMVYTEHGRFYPDRKSWKRSLFNPLLALGVDYLISISESTKQAMVEYDNLPLRRIQVIHNGVDLSRMNPPIDLAAKRRELGLSQRCRVIGTAARLDRVKNIPLMLRAFRLVSESMQDAVLMVAGEGPEGEALKQLTVQLGIAEKVKFLGLRFDMPQIYPLMEVFLLTSLSEGISVTLLEAMASGVPAVVTDVGGNREVVLQGETGFLVKPGDEAAVAERTVGLLTDHQQQQEMGAKARERAETRFTFERMLQHYRKVYHSPPLCDEVEGRSTVGSQVGSGEVVS